MVPYGVRCEQLNGQKFSCIVNQTVIFFLHLFQVNDYVKNYIGDGKGPKNFAKDYVERRSKWRNALKSKKKFEDDLLTPAAAINPNNDDEVRNSIFQFNGFFVRFRCPFFRQKSCSAAELRILSRNRNVQSY